jgi:hypothetical protein
MRDGRVLVYVEEKLEEMYSLDSVGFPDKDFKRR